MADGILLERAGLPTVSICTDPFALTARAMAKAYGFPGFEYVSIPHPVASLSEAQIRARVDGLLPDLLRILGVELGGSVVCRGRRRAAAGHGVLRGPRLDRRAAGRACTVRLAAINAALAGCRPEYFPVVLAAWESLAAEGYPAKGIWQSTTGTAPFLIVNGPVRERIGLNSTGNVFGSGFRANATIGRAIRLGVLNAFGLRPHELDQATQGTPAKYTFCIAENEEESPWPALHVECGLTPSDSAVTAMVIRSCVHIEARHTRAPEQLATDIAGTISRTGALIHETISAAVVLSPEHARLLSAAGWDKSDLRQFLYDHAVRTRAELAAAGKEAISSRTRWRLPADHPDALPMEAGDGAVRVLNSPAAVLVVVAGAGNAGVSAVVETFGPRGGPPPVTRIRQ